MDSYYYDCGVHRQKFFVQVAKENPMSFNTKGDILIADKCLGGNSFQLIPVRFKQPVKCLHQFLIGGWLDQV